MDFGDPNVTYVVLADAQGQVLWKTAGPANTEKAAELEEHLKQAKGSGPSETGEPVAGLQ